MGRFGDHDRWQRGPLRFRGVGGLGGGQLFVQALRSVTEPLSFNKLFDVQHGLISELLRVPPQGGRDVIQTLAHGFRFIDDDVLVQWVQCFQSLQPLVDHFFSNLQFGDPAGTIGYQSFISWSCAHETD